MQEENKKTETKKQEAIRLSWEKIIGKEKYELIKEDVSQNTGYTDKNNIDFSLHPIYNFQARTVKNKKVTIRVRPKELEDVENNRGWIAFRYVVRFVGYVKL